MHLDVFPPMFYKWAEINFKRKNICAVLICYESITIFCSRPFYLKPLLSPLVTRDFHVYSNYSVSC